MTTGVPDTGVAVPTQTVYIVGFAPSWPQTPWNDPNAQRWGMNSLHTVAGDRPWDVWFQLHDIDKHHPHDKAEHIAWLVQSGLPVYMWKEHVAKYGLPNAVPYPREEITKYFGQYFTNTVSWMIALAIYQRFKKIGVYGVNMAQDAEYIHQRPSVEFFLGWARGAGIELEIPSASDLLKAPFLYGYQDDGGAFSSIIEARLQELIERKAQMEQQREQAHSVVLQLVGALEDINYVKRVWTPIYEGLKENTNAVSQPR